MFTSIIIHYHNDIPITDGTESFALQWNKL